MDDRVVIRHSQHGFTKANSCLTDLMAFYNGVTVLVDKGRATDTVYLDFCKAFDTVSHNILVTKLERYGFDRWTIHWIRNWLDGYIQRVAVNEWLYVQTEISNKAKRKVLHMGQGNPQYQYRLGDEGIESSPAEKDLRILVDKKIGRDPATCACSPESQLYPGLHQKKRGQQVKGGDSPFLPCSHGTPPGALCPALGLMVPDRHGPVRAGAEEGHKNDQRAGTPLL
ncbi:cAMP-dependent protein kinase inhibitor alpha [Grus japonensis]|uniref:cAMP-dependent protein kinase inhibitor alpha n=1 Tax=Grus japonensis TaxID=30415 RepID=A0ABC9WK25_GRUJA